MALYRQIMLATMNTLPHFFFPLSSSFCPLLLFPLPFTSSLLSLSLSHSLSLSFLPLPPLSPSPSLPLTNRSKCDQLTKVIEQLEQERGVASKRASRLQDELQRVQQVSDAEHNITILAHCLHVFICMYNARIESTCTMYNVVMPLCVCAS